jgi:thiamine-phosphate pyrophosphorylase
MIKSPVPHQPNSTSSASRGRTSTPRQRLYLVTPQIDDAAAFSRELDHILGAGDIAAILLRLADASERALIERTKHIATVVQPRDVALLVDNRPEIVARAGADGAHVSGVEKFAAALALLKPARIAGAGGLRSRHARRRSWCRLRDAWRT